MSYLAEVKEAIKFLRKKGQKQIALLQCTSIYPVDPAHVNLKVIEPFLTAWVLTYKALMVSCILCLAPLWGFFFACNWLTNNR